ncbi:DUF5819 family protein [Streptacidiphilus sp. MAP12-16]|uniref:DUF5819 family protein n=1 Tax=Streptacidiphilus sp. MAP12-16 TaxID=3156300 RepID=UPI0035181391
MLYTLACLVYNAPASPAKTRLATPVNAVINPYFGQDWMLFAPAPSTVNDILMMDVKLKAGNSEGETTTIPVDIEEPIDRMPRSNRVMPTKLPGVLLALQESFTNYANGLNDALKAPKAQQPALEDALSRRYAAEFVELQRFLSIRAGTMYPDAQIIAVRATFDKRPITPFSERDMHPAPKQPVQGVLQTAWMPYVSGVAD